MNTHAVDTGTGFRLTGRKILLIFVAFFGTVAAADSVLLTSALRTWSGLEERSPYQAGQRYNAELATAREQDARGWSVDLRTQRLDNDGLSVEVAGRDRTGRPLAGLTAQLLLERPTDKRLDITADLSDAGSGAYRAVLDNVPAGQWDLILDLTEGSERVYRRRTRLILR